ncbi:hypothetical protein ACSBR1_000599 [Camellia fascicularis]
MDKSLMPKAFTSHHHSYSSTIDSLKPPTPTNTTHTSQFSTPSSSPMLIYTYDNVVHGFSALLFEAELASVKKSQGYVSAYIDRKFQLHNTHTPEFLSLNLSSGLWPALNYSEDVIVGVVDSRVWPESLSFKEDGFREDGMRSSPIPARWKGMCKVGQEFNASMCNSKLIGARYFNKGLIAAGEPNLTISINLPRDTEGHGTHTASTVAGNYVNGASFFEYAEETVKGLASRARVAVYKVFRDPYFAYYSDIIVGIDQAVTDGVNILSLWLPLGSFFL